MDKILSALITSVIIGFSIFTTQVSLAYAPAKQTCNHQMASIDQFLDLPGGEKPLKVPLPPAYRNTHIHLLSPTGLHMEGEESLYLLAISPEMEPFVQPRNTQPLLIRANLAKRSYSISKLPSEFRRPDQSNLLIKSRTTVLSILHENPSENSLPNPANTTPTDPTAAIPTSIQRLDLKTLKLDIFRPKHITPKKTQLLHATLDRSIWKNLLPPQIVVVDHQTKTETILPLGNFERGPLFSDDGSTLLTIDPTNPSLLHMYNLKQTTLSPTDLTVPDIQPRPTRISKDGTRLIYDTSDSVHLAALDGNKVVPLLNFSLKTPTSNGESEFHSVDYHFSNDGQWMFMSSGNGHCYLYRTSDGKQMQTWEAERLTISEDQTTVALKTKNPKSILIYNFDRGTISTLSKSILESFGYSDKQTTLFQIADDLKSVLFIQHPQIDNAPPAFYSLDLRSFSVRPGDPFSLTKMTAEAEVEYVTAEYFNTPGVITFHDRRNFRDSIETARPGNLDVKDALEAMSLLGDSKLNASLIKSMKVFFENHEYQKNPKKALFVCLWLLRNSPQTLPSLFEKWTDLSEVFKKPIRFTTAEQERLKRNGKILYQYLKSPKAPYPLEIITLFKPFLHLVEDSLPATYLHEIAGALATFSDNLPILSSIPSYNRFKLIKERLRFLLGKRTYGYSDIVVTLNDNGNDSSNPVRSVIAFGSEPIDGLPLNSFGFSAKKIGQIDGADTKTYRFAWKSGKKSQKVEISVRALPSENLIPTKQESPDYATMMKNGRMTSYILISTNIADMGGDLSQEYIRYLRESGFNLRESKQMGADALREELLGSIEKGGVNFLLREGHSEFSPETVISLSSSVVVTRAEKSLSNGLKEEFIVVQSVSDEKAATVSYADLGTALRARSASHQNQELLYLDSACFAFNNRQSYIQQTAASGFIPFGTEDIATTFYISPHSGIWQILEGFRNLKPYSKMSKPKADAKYILPDSDAYFEGLNADNLVAAEVKIKRHFETQWSKP